MALTDKLTAIGNAVRSKTGGTSPLSLDDMATAISGISGGGFDYSGITGGIGFRDAADQTTIDLSTLDTSGFTNMSNMFYQCSHLTSLDLSSFDTAAVTNMRYMFSMCEALASLNLSGFDTSNVDVMNNMFQGTGLASLDLTHFDTSNVTTMAYMFYNSNKLATLDLTGDFSSEAVTTMAYMFYGCSSLESLDLRGFNTPELTTMANMFENCTKLKSIYLPNIDTTKCTSSNYAFRYCSKLEALIWGTNKTTVQKLPSTLSNSSMNLVTHLYVPNDLVSSYQSYTNWSNMSARIHGVSDLPQVYKDLYGIE